MWGHAIYILWHTFWTNVAYVFGEDLKICLCQFNILDPECTTKRVIYLKLVEFPWLKVFTQRNMNWTLENVCSVLNVTHGFGNDSRIRAIFKTMIRRLVVRSFIEFLNKLSELIFSVTWKCKYGWIFFLLYLCLCMVMNIKSAQQFWYHE